MDLVGLDISPIDPQLLDSPFYEAEIFGDIKSLPLNKAPGPDGFTTEFYRAA